MYLKDYLEAGVRRYARGRTIRRSTWHAKIIPCINSTREWGSKPWQLNFLQHFHYLHLNILPKLRSLLKASEIEGNIKCTDNVCSSRLNLSRPGKKIEKRSREETLKNTSKLPRGLEYERFHQASKCVRQTSKGEGRPVPSLSRGAQCR